MIIAFLTGTLVVGLPQISPTQAWGLATHMWMVEYAIDAMPTDEWKDSFEFFEAQIKAGSITPDVVWQDWDNHLYYPHTGEHSAPAAVSRWFGYLRGNLSIGAWDEAMFAAGVMSHYFTDPNIPVHTDENWSGHGALEDDINYHLATFTPTIADLLIVDNASQYLIDLATISHDYYDECRALYPTGTIPSPSPLDDNPTFHNIIEDQLSRAITGLRNLWYTATQGLDPPTIPTGMESWTILIDEGHANAYTTEAEDQLSSFKNFLNQYSVNWIVNEDAITPDDLQAVDLLVITAPFTAFSVSEIATIASWIVSETEGHMLITGYSDFYVNFERKSVNWLLSNCTSHIVLNDDQVFDSNNEPRPWYADIDDVIPGSLTLGITNGIARIRMFSTSTLWFTGSGTLTNITYGDPQFYQTDNNPPPPPIIYDTTPDLVGGEIMPLMAVEQIGDSRIFVSGTTFFSDFDYGATDFSNAILIKNAIEWLLDTTLEAIDVYGPIISDVIINPLVPMGGQPLTISAKVNDSAGVENVTLCYQLDNGPEKELTMTALPNTEYQVTIPGAETALATNITYHIKAFDTNNNWRKTLTTSVEVIPGIPINPLIPYAIPIAITIIIIAILIGTGYWWYQRKSSSR